jgi:hypothetical protein
MNFQQDAVLVSLKTEEKYWEASVDGEVVQGSLSLIVQKLAESGWEIVAVTPSVWLADNHLSGPVATGSFSAVTAVMIFVKKTG